MAASAELHTHHLLSVPEASFSATEWSYYFDRS